MSSPSERFRVLGPLEVVGADGVRAVQGDRQRLLLAALLAAGGAAVPAETLIELLWGESAPANPAASLHSQVARLRRSLADVLDPDCDLVTRPPGYALTTGPDDVDARRFERLLAQARGGEPGTAAEDYAQALAMWRGAAYGEFADAYPAHIEGIRLDELRLAAVEERARALVALGTPEVAIPELEAFIAGNPLREEALGLLMRALYDAGLQTRALNLYQETGPTLPRSWALSPRRPSNGFRSRSSIMTWRCRPQSPQPRGSGLVRSPNRGRKWPAGHRLIRSRPGCRRCRCAICAMRGTASPTRQSGPDRGS